jgi:hypothetical protein
MKHPLKDCIIAIIAITGEFGEGKSQVNLERWIVANEGSYANTIEMSIISSVPRKIGRKRYTKVTQSILLRFLMLKQHLY